LRKIIHIGLGKTGTTQLQLKIFPVLDRLGILHYRDDLNQKISNNNFRRKVLNESSQTKLDFGLDKFSNNSIHLVSNEHILSWDPRDWQISLSNLLSDFGNESEILITLRDPSSYLRSIYQQRVQEGESDLTPEHFFLKSDLYDKHRDYFGKSNSERRFSVDELEYNYLFNFLAKKFNKIYFSDMQTTLNWQFLVDMNIIDISTYERLIKLNDINIDNKSYSKRAMQLDNKRYKILNTIDLMPLSNSIIIRNKSEKLLINSLGLNKEKRNIAFNTSNKLAVILMKIKIFINQFSTISKILRLPYKLLVLPYRVFKNWRFFLQDFVNNYFKYEKFELPSETYLGKHFEANVDFYKKMPLSKGYKK